MKKINFILLAMFFTAYIVISSCSDTSEQDINDLAEDLEAFVDETVVDNKFYSEDGNFKANFSGTPEITKEDVPSDYGNIEMFMFLYEKSITEAEMIAYSDYPSAIVEISSTDQMLQDAKGGSVNSLGAVISEEKKLTFNGHKAIQFRADNSQFYVDYLIFLVNNRLYQVAIMRDGSYATKENVDKFFNSFELVE